MRMAPLEKVAPSIPSDYVYSDDDQVWHLGLEHIESNTGRILKKVKNSASTAGNSTIVFDESNVLYSKLRPNLNKVVCPDERGIATSELVPLRPNPDELDRKYLAQYLRSPRFVSWITGMVQGAKMPRAKMSEFWKHEMPLPPIDEQKRIAAILDKADGIRRKRQQALKLTDQFLQSLFLEMFGDPVTNPKGWDETRLEEVSEIRSGVTKGRRFNGRPTVHVPYMRVASVQDGYLRTDIITEIEVLPEDVEKFKLEPGDVLLTEGGDPDKLGRGAVWRGQLDICIHQNHIFRVRPEIKKIDPDFLSAVVGSGRGKRYFLSAAKQTTGIASINMTQLKAFPCLLPPIELQNQFAVRTQSIEDLRLKLSTIVERNDELFSSLVQRAFRGEL